jgi:hypothetical protein
MAEAEAHRPRYTIRHTFTERPLVICPNCGEDNATAFRFCGMCGTSLEPRKPAPNIATTASQPPTTRLPDRRLEARQVPVILDTSPPSRQPTTIAGPSLLGLNPDPPQEPTIDTLREKSFSALNSYLEQEESNGGKRRILVLLGLLVVLGAAGWWTYSNYLGAMGRPVHSAVSKPSASLPTPQPTPSTPDSSSATSGAPPTNSASGEAPAPAAAPEQKTASAPPKDATPPPAKPAVVAQQETASTPKPAIEVKAVRAKPTHDVVPPVQSASSATPALEDTGDSAYKKAEAFLYGRGVEQNCDEAVKYLKAASAKQNPKARSTFGTMYATGHCVPRDLPTSYGWFALALRVDPNNQILEKDLTAIWNQMTQPERDMATRMKP